MRFLGRVYKSAAAAAFFAHGHNDSPSISENSTKLSLTLFDKREKALQKVSAAVNRFMVINGVPGVSVGVSLDGLEVFRMGFGLADVETGAPCTGDSVMRIASISKAITAAVAAKLFEAGQLDLDKSIYEYLKDDFPEKQFANEKVTITTRQLLSHLAGIRHYSKEDCEQPEKQILNNEENLLPSLVEGALTTEKALKANSNLKTKEFLSNKKYKTVIESLEIFKDDNLVAKPGDKFYYTTHGFTLASAVFEKASNKTFCALLKELFIDLGMHNTFVDVKAEIVANRAKYYKRNSLTHRLENVLEVDNSCKWAGGGLISNVHDLLNFSNSLLYSFQSINPDNSFLSRESVEKLWAKEIEVPTKAEKSKKSYYGLGWMIVEPATFIGGVALHELSGYWFHTGAAVGASSVLLIKPSPITKPSFSPSGVCVAILANCQDSGAGIVNLAREIADIFESDYRQAV